MRTVWFAFLLSVLPLRAAEPILTDAILSMPTGKRVRAYLVRPGDRSVSGPAVLFVHWLETGSPDSNRTQFLAQALDLARSGVTSLLPETMWSDPAWFEKRDPDKDYDRSLEQTAELGKALDYLLAQPGVDQTRVAYVGHDFGMMYGLLLAKTEKRINVWALQAGTAGFEDWYLLGRDKIPEPEKQKVRDRLHPIAPLNFIGGLTRPVLLQFGLRDPYVPRGKAEALANAAPEPKKVLYYDAGHALNAEAIRDRMAWLREQLKLKPAGTY